MTLNKFNVYKNLIGIYLELYTYHQKLNIQNFCHFVQ